MACHEITQCSNAKLKCNYMHGCWEYKSKTNNLQPIQKKFLTYIIHSTHIHGDIKELVVWIIRCGEYHEKDKEILNRLRDVYKDDYIINKQ